MFPNHRHKINWSLLRVQGVYKTNHTHSYTSTPDPVLMVIEHKSGYVDTVLAYLHLPSPSSKEDGDEE